VAGDTNGVGDIIVRDLVALTTIRLSTDSAGVQGNGHSSRPALSGDGLWVAFESDATNLVATDTNATRDVFRRHRTGNVIRRVSVDSGGSQGLGGGSSGPSISIDGRSVAFQSDATNLVPGDTNGSTDIFVHDCLFQTTVRVSVDSGGTQGSSSSGGTSISADGRHVAFDSFAPNLVPNDTNGFQDVFLRDQGTASAFLSFCFGDGTAGSCPCSNSGDPGRGCQNSDTTGGALLTVTGTASLSEDTVQLTSSYERPTALSVFLQGNAVVGPLNYGDGLRCTGGTLKRIYVKAAVNGVVVGPETGDPSISARSSTLGAPIPLGATRLYQAFYRDPPPGFCPSGTFNVSNGIAIAWGA